MALNGFSILLFVPLVQEVLVAIKRTIYTAFYPLILRLQLSHNTFENKVYYDLATTLYYLSNKERKLTNRPEVIWVARGGAMGPMIKMPLIEMPPMIKRMTTKPIVYSISVSFRIYAYNSI